MATDSGSSVMSEASRGKNRTNNATGADYPHWGIVREVVALNAVSAKMMQLVRNVGLCDESSKFHV